MASQSRTPLRRPSSSSTPASAASPRTKTTSSSSIIAKGATARSAVSPRAIPAASSRTRAAAQTSSSSRSSPVPGGDTNGNDTLVASLKRETEEKEELLVRIQEKDAQIAEYRQESDNLTSALHAAETRLTELYADQARAEEEMAARMEIAEKLRAQVRELEREKREALRRYAEQTASFEAERQALYDNEQHLKSRIQSLTAARKAQQEAAERPSSPVPSVAQSVGAGDTHLESTAGSADSAQTASHREDDPNITDGPEITALKMELSTLSTSHNSLQTMVQMLQVELADLKRVNNELQEENESYGLLLMERALNGTGIEMLRQMGGQDQASSRAESVNDDNERASIRSSKRSLLDRVPEDEEYAFDVDQQDVPNSLAAELRSGEDLSMPSSRRRRTRQNSISPTPGTPVGESLADLPITGPGLDLAAELGRAESRDILEGVQPETPAKGRASKDVTESQRDKEVETLRAEVKSLKDANKALSLYASKIIDRIIMQDGFEQVLSVDFDPSKSPTTPNPKSPGAFEDVLAKAKNSPSKPPSKPQSGFLGRSLSLKTNVVSPPPRESSLRFPGAADSEKLTTFSTPAPPPADSRRSRRSLSFDWKSFSLFGGTNESAEKEKSLRPLTLRPGAASALSGARKLESQEDEDDRKERERLNATMKLMGIEKPPESPAPPTARPRSEIIPQESETSKLQGRNRFSWFFGGGPNPAAQPQESDAPASLTSEALEQAEAESSLASLDAREKILTAEIAKGGSGGFTELNNSGGLTLGEQWRNRRSRSTSGKSHDSSGASTVWSAGKGDDE